MTHLDRLDPEPDLEAGATLVVGCVRNEALRLPDFLAHHRSLGVDHFLLIDNGSHDGTVEFLQSQVDVCLFATTEAYSESMYGVTWTNEILDTYARMHWTLVLDADELFIYPGFETARLPQLTAWLDAQGHEALAAPMLDMYPRAPLAQLDYKPGQSLIAANPYFDATGYEFLKIGNGNRLIHRGGPRQRLFWDGVKRGYPGPVLTKFPLMKWRAGLALEASTHILRGASVAGVTGLLLHFKFMQDFAYRAGEEAERKEHYLGARQYAAYADVLSTSPSICAYTDNSVRYETSKQLVDLGLMNVPEPYPF